MSFFKVRKLSLYFFKTLAGMTDLRPQREARRKDLEKELAKLKLSLRHDSRLCAAYINNHTSPDWTPAKVARECAVMHWLHNFTDYEMRCQMAATEVSKQIWFRSGRHFADHVKRRVYPAIKETIIKENNGHPDTWPWMKTTLVTTDTTSTVKTTSAEETTVS